MEARLISTGYHFRTAPSASSCMSFLFLYAGPGLGSFLVPLLSLDTSGGRPPPAACNFSPGSNARQFLYRMHHLSHLSHVWGKGPVGFSVCSHWVLSMTFRPASYAASDEWKHSVCPLAFAILTIRYGAQNSKFQEQPSAEREILFNQVIIERQSSQMIYLMLVKKKNSTPVYFLHCISLLFLHRVHVMVTLADTLPNYRSPLLESGPGCLVLVNIIIAACKLAHLLNHD